MAAGEERINQETGLREDAKQDSSEGDCAQSSLTF